MKFVLSNKFKIVIIFGISILFSSFLINQTVEFKRDLQGRDEFGWDFYGNSKWMSNRYNSTVYINEETNISQFAQSGDGKSWETAYLINSTYFESANAQSCLIINNSDSYIIIQQSIFDFREYTDDEFNNSEIYTIRLLNSSNIKLKQCEIYGYFHQDNDIGLLMNNSKNIIVENSDFDSSVEQVIIGELSDDILFYNNYFNYGDIPSNFNICNNVSFLNNLFFGKFSPLSTSDEFFISGDYVLEILGGRNWTIANNQIEYVNKGFFLRNCQNFLIQDNTFFALYGSALFIWESNEIFILYNTFSYGNVALMTCSDVQLRGNKFYGNKIALDLYASNSIDISENFFYNIEPHVFTFVGSSENPVSEISILKNVFVKCKFRLDLSKRGDWISAKYNLFLGGVQDLWSGFVICYLLYLIFNFSLHNKLLTKLSKKYKFRDEELHNKSPKSEDIHSIIPNNLSLVKSPDQIINNIRKVATSQYLSRSFLLLFFFILIIISGLLNKSQGYRILDFFRDINGEPLYNVYYLDDKLYIWGNILFSVLIAIAGFKIHSISTKTLRKTVMFREISHSDSIKEFIPFGLFFIGFWFSFLSLVESSGNWILALFMLLFIFLIIAEIWIKYRKYKGDVKLFNGKIIEE